VKRGKREKNDQLAERALAALLPYRERVAVASAAAPGGQGAA
jgi:hypothetical protein